MDLHLETASPLGAAEALASAPARQSSAERVTQELRPLRAGQRTRILAVASSGGHWVQLMRLLPALAAHEVAFVSTEGGHREAVEGRRFYRVPDANKRQKLRMVALLLKTLLIIVRERPQVVITTGAAPGYWALRFAKVLGARTVWIDSIANAEKLSLSGRLARRHADLWLTQWEHLASPEGPQYAGAVL